MDARKAYEKTLGNIRKRLIDGINKSVTNGDCCASVYLPHWINSSNINIIENLLIESDYTGYEIIHNGVSNIIEISWRFDKLSKENDLTKVV